MIVKGKKELLKEIGVVALLLLVVIGLALSSLFVGRVEAAEGDITLWQYEAEQGVASDWMPIPGGVPQGFTFTTEQWDAVIGSSEYKYVQRRTSHTSNALDPNGSVDIFVSQQPFSVSYVENTNPPYYPHYLFLHPSVYGQQIRVYSPIADMGTPTYLTISSNSYQYASSDIDLPLYLINKHGGNGGGGDQPSLTYFYPENGNITISQEQLMGTDENQLMAILQVNNAAAVFIAKDGPGDVIDWDTQEVYSKTDLLPNADFYINMTPVFRSMKDELTLGTHRFFYDLYNQTDWDDPNGQPTVQGYFDVKVVYDNSQIPDPDGGGSGDMPKAPSPPDQNWDVVGWLKYLFDWITYVFQIIVYMLKRLGNMIADGFGAVTGLGDALTAYFSWLPPEVIAVMVMGLIAAILTGLIRR